MQQNYFGIYPKIRRTRDQFQISEILLFVRLFFLKNLTLKKSLISFIIFKR